ncbi:MAG: 4-(cytidine 5'-diphospho)-2-C-methyl-D-erythritol kinase [Oligoflexia bacterium]|nr:4-(cytidine 5'-diphospho)-2-C-methyl-D-erythritol kinase [Oligoflexia bacterium]
MQLFSPAKINLNLKILGTRSDGYHLLDSIFLPISLFDEINIFKNTATASDEVDFVFPSVTRKLKNNTVEKVLLKARQINPKLPFFKVTVKKNIPVGAGLGGGSSNAAAVLNYLNEQFLELKEEELVDFASHIGADVPFFLKQKAARVTGIGEKIELIDNIGPLELIICRPPFSISTKEAYSWYDAQSKLTASTIGANSMICGVNLINDLEVPVIKKRPEIADIKKALIENGALGSLMTGSGSAVFGVFKTQQAATEALEPLKKCFNNNYTFYLAKSL